MENNKYNQAENQEGHIFTEKQLSRLTSFQNMLEIADTCEVALDEGTTWGCYWVGLDDPDERELILKGDSRFVNIMRMTAFNMYLNFAETDPELLEASQQLLNYRRHDKQEINDLERDALIHMFNVD